MRPAPRCARSSAPRSRRAATSWRPGASGSTPSWSPTATSSRTCSQVRSRRRRRLRCCSPLHAVEGAILLSEDCDCLAPGPELLLQAHMGGGGAQGLREAVERSQADVQAWGRCSVHKHSDRDRLLIRLPPRAQAGSCWRSARRRGWATGAPLPARVQPAALAHSCLVLPGVMHGHPGLHSMNCIRWMSQVAGRRAGGAGGAPPVGG